MAELPEHIHNSISDYCAKGDRFAESKDFTNAQICYANAWLLLPEPKDDWHAATWILAAQADSAFLANDIISARNYLDKAMQIEGNVGKPFLHLRRGQVLFEQDEFDGAADELIRAYALCGPEMFANDSDKYIKFLATRCEGIELP